MATFLPVSAAPDEEVGRLAALHALALLDSKPQREFDSLVALAAEMLGCPTALFNLVDRDRVWIKASTTAMPSDIGRDVAYCDHTIRQAGPLVIDDLSRDPRFSGNPLVIDAGHRFYAGTAIRVTDADGIRQPVGTLCVVDDRPRSLAPGGHAALAHLGVVAEALIEARRTAVQAVDIATTGEMLLHRLASKDRVFRQAERIAMIGSWRLCVTDRSLEWSDNVHRIHGLPSNAQPDLDHAMDYYPPHERERVSNQLARTLSTGESFDLESDFVTADGRLRRVRVMGETEMAEGRVVAVVGVFQDVTDRYALEVQLRRTADTDALTGIANRACFDRDLERAIDRARRQKSPLLLLLVDLDGFKMINDTLGHAAGDDVLRMTGAALSQPWLRGSAAARIGGDEFALIVEDPALIADPDALRRRIAETLLIAVEADGLTMRSAGSIGAALLDDECVLPRDLMRRADATLYADKRARNGARYRGAADRRAA